MPCMLTLQFQRELAAMTLLSHHKNVLPLLGACMQPNLAALVTPYCPRFVQDERVSSYNRLLPTQRAALAQESAVNKKDSMAAARSMHRRTEKHSRAIFKCMQGLPVRDAALANAGDHMGSGGSHVLRGRPRHAAPARPPSAPP